MLINMTKYRKERLFRKRIFMQKEYFISIFRKRIFMQKEYFISIFRVYLFVLIQITIIDIIIFKSLLLYV